MSNQSIRLRVEPIRSLAAGSISGTYAAIGSAFTRPSHILYINNLTDADLMISFDGAVDHVVIAAKSFLLLDCTTNKSNPEGFFVTTGTIIYAKELTGAPTLGSIYVTTFYASNN